MTGRKTFNGKRLMIFATVLMILGFLISVTLLTHALNADTLNVNTNSTSETVNSGKYIAILGAAIAFGLAALGAGIGIGMAGSSALSAAAENPELRTFGLIITALAEALAIYGLLVVILILGA